MDNNKELAVTWLGRLAAQKAKDGLNTQYAPIKGGLLQSSRFGHSMAVTGSAESTPVKGKPAQASAEFYRANRRHLGLPEDQRALGRPRVLRDKNFEILYYEPRIKGFKVDGAHVSLAMASRRRTDENMLISLKSDVRLDLPIKGAFRMKPHEAVTAAAEALGFRASEEDIKRLVSSSHIRIERVLAPFRSALHRAFRVTPIDFSSEYLKERFGKEMLQVVVDAENGFVLRTRPMVCELLCRVSAFDENAVKSFRNIDRTSHIVDGRIAEIIPPSTGQNVLKNDYFNVFPGHWVTINLQRWLKERLGRASTNGTEFLYVYNDYPHISEANAFLHLNRVRDMLLRAIPTFDKQTTAPDGMPLRIFVDVPSTSFNAFSWSDGKLEFRTFGGVGAADDADLVVHEYAHQIHFVLAPYINSSEIYETVADFIACIYAHDTSLSELWNNRNLVTGGQILQPDFEPGPFTTLREIYNDRRYPEDYTISGHNKSLILSGALMELHLDFYNRFGAEDYFIVLKTLIAALPMIADSSDLLDAASTFYMLVVLVAWFSGDAKWRYLAEQTIRVFTRRGLID